jgi:hypothetical protein
LIKYELKIKDIVRMRKRLKKKKHSCALCKPHKMGKCGRWKEKDLSALKEFEQTKMAGG